MGFVDDFNKTVLGIDTSEKGFSEKLEVLIKIQQGRAICSIADSLKVIAEAYDLPKDIPDSFPSKGDNE